MGNMVNVSLLTDCWSDFERDPERLLRAITAEGMYGDPHYPYGPDAMQGVTAHPYHHADSHEIYSDHRNLSLCLSRWDKRTIEFAQSEHGREDLRRRIEVSRWSLDQLEKTLDELDGKA
jgi:hypothetical protein